MGENCLGSPRRRRDGVRHRPAAPARGVRSRARDPENRPGRPQGGYAVAEVKPGKFKVSVTEVGSLEAAQRMDVMCQIEGRTTIISILPEGTRVKKGDLVCELDSASLRDQLVN